MTGPRVVIIGAGVVGAALADELSARGWTDVTVVDQGSLPAAGGSSSHAPGLVFQANSAKVMTKLARYTVEKLGALELDGEPCFLPVGSLEVATTPERLRELHRRHGWLTAWGVRARVLDAAQTVAIHDLLDPSAVLGALHVPSDGLVKGVRAVEAQLRAAKARGVRVLDRHEVLDIRYYDGAVRAVITNHGELPADIVVCCAGIWGPKVARMLGVNLPLTPLAHQFAWTEPLPDLAGVTAEATRPIVRHQGADLYFRERFDRLGIGWYGHEPMPITPEEILPVDVADPMPSVQAFTPGDFAPALDATRELFPAAREAKVDDGMNGLFSFTTDNMPLLGPCAGVEGFWVAEAVWVTHSAGVGRAVAEWLLEAPSSFDLHECDVNRFEPHQLAPAYVLERSCQNYIEVYDALHPLEPMRSPRPLRISPFHRRQAELGAHFLEATGWERPQWYGSNAALLEWHDVPRPNDWAAQHWSPIVGAEALATRAGVALFDMTALKRVEVRGAGATEFLQSITTGDIDKPVGAVTYCLLLDADGRVRSDITVARLGPNLYQVGCNGNLDLEWLRYWALNNVCVTDLTPGTCCLGLWGPRARDLVAPLANAAAGFPDFSSPEFRYFRAARGYVGTVPVTAMRLSYVGELGWELYTSADMGLKLWDTLWEAGREHGLIAAGRGAFNSLRLEKGYRSNGLDMTFEHDPYEAGLGFAVKLDKPEFMGRHGVVDKADEPPRRRLACLVADDPTDVVMGKEPVYDGTGCVGYVTSAAYGYTVGKAIAYAWLPAALATPGRTLSIGYFDRRIEATVAAEPLFDAGMTRLRA